MKLILEYIKELMAAETRVDGPYTHPLADDEPARQKSVLVPDDIKDKIFGYFDKMGLSSRRKSKKSKRAT